VRTITEVLEDFWYRLDYFIRHDRVIALKWLGKFVVGMMIIIVWDLKAFFQRKIKKKGGAR